jgi:diketogulonate reductase-like aldo/keto reductase
MPAIGFGTGIGAADVEKHHGSSQAEVTIAAVNTALDCGYRAIDTAQRYGTEPPVGEVLKQRFASGSLGRGDIFVTTKVSNPRPAPAGMLEGGGIKYMLQPELSAYDGVLNEFAGCLKNLQLDYVDLLLIHFPGPPAGDGTSLSPELSQKKRLEAWRALEALHKEGKARAIGVSNYCERHLLELVGVAEFMPMVNQVELHPRLTQPRLRAFCAEHRIVVTAYSPLSGADLEAEAIAAIAAQHSASPAAVVLSWLRQHGCIVIPKSLSPGRIKANLSDSVVLSAAEMDRLDGLDEGRRINADTEGIV